MTTRAERLATQRDAYLDWARTATTDEPPADLGAPVEVPEAAIEADTADD